MAQCEYHLPEMSGSGESVTLCDRIKAVNSGCQLLTMDEANVLVPRWCGKPASIYVPADEEQGWHELWVCAECYDWLAKRGMAQ
jgi:hypothetical protein